jgi:hypothetical protein
MQVMTRSTQLNSKRWEQLAFEYPAGVHLAPPLSGIFLRKHLEQRCPMCGAALVHVDVGEQCTRCGVVVDL